MSEPRGRPEDRTSDAPMPPPPGQAAGVPVTPANVTVTVAPVSSTRRGLSTEVHVGRRNGLARPSAVKCDQIMSIPIERLGERCGWLLESQEDELRDAIHAAFDLP